MPSAMDWGRGSPPSREQSRDFAVGGPTPGTGPKRTAVIASPEGGLAPRSCMVKANRSGTGEIDEA
jgi:hypothetical protein